MVARFESILETVGNTPVVRIKKLAPPHVRLYAMVEAFNPMGSVKDRLALDSVEYQAEERGAKIRAALSARTSLATIPQIFVGGELLGGCTDLFDAYKRGRLQELLEKNQVAYERNAQLDPYSFLPTWLHPR